MKTIGLSAAIIAASTWMGAAIAAPVTIPNASFEAAYPQDNSLLGIGNWSQAVGPTGETGAVGGLTPTAGSSMLFINGPDGSGPGLVYQRLNILQPGTYTFQVDVGFRNDVGESATYDIAFYAVNPVAETNDATLARDENLPAPAAETWETRTFSFTVDGTEPWFGTNVLQIALTTPTGVQVCFDNLTGTFTPALGAGPIKIPNSSFETPYVQDNSLVGNGYWSQAASPTGEIGGPTGGLYPTDGSLFLFINGPDATGPGLVYQRLNILQPGTYTFQVDVGLRNDVGESATYDIAFYAVDPVAETNDATLAREENLPAPAAETWETRTFSFTVDGTEPWFGTDVLQIALTTPTGIQVCFDNVRGEFAPASGGSYTSWADAYGAADPPLLATASTADPDNDGLTNAVEYALGLDPRFSSGSPGVPSNNGKTITFTKGAEAKTNGDVTYQIEISETLGVAPSPWTPATSPDLLEDADTIAITFPAGPVKNFARLKVTLASP
jgi:hypothetical protein